jgi:molybdate transport system substrate-binding protein
LRAHGDWCHTIGDVTRVILFVLLTAGVAVESAAELTIMSAGAVETGLRRLVERFERDTGHSVNVEIGNAPQLDARLKTGDTADVLIAPAAVMDRAVASGQVRQETRVTLGRVGVAVVVRAGAPPPDIGTPDALRSALLAAGAVIYNQGSSGTYIERMIARLGIAEQVASKAVRVLNGEAVTDRIATGGAADLAFMAIPDAIRGAGLRYVGPLPAALQNVTTYDAAVMRSAREPRAADAFLTFATTEAARQALRATGID